MTEEKTAEEIVDEIIEEDKKEAEEVKKAKKAEVTEYKEVKDDEKPYLIRFTARELKNTRIRKALLNLIDLKAREQRQVKYVLITQSEFDVLIKYNPSFLVPAKKYAKRKKDLVYEGEVGKYQGKRLVVRE